MNLPRCDVVRHGLINQLIGPPNRPQLRRDPPAGLSVDLDPPIVKLSATNRIQIGGVLQFVACVPIREMLRQIVSVGEVAGVEVLSVEASRVNRIAHENHLLAASISALRRHLDMWITSHPCRKPKLRRPTVHGRKARMSQNLSIDHPGRPAATSATSKRQVCTSA